MDNQALCLLLLVGIVLIFCMFQSEGYRNLKMPEEKRLYNPSNFKVQHPEQKTSYDQNYPMSQWAKLGEKLIKDVL